MVFKRQSAEQGDFLFDGHPAETGDIRNLTGNGRPENKRNAPKDIRTELQMVSSKISGFVLDGLQFCLQRAEHRENHPLS